MQESVGLPAGKPASSERKCREVSFNDNPEIYRIKVHGVRRKLVYKPRNYAVCYLDKQNCPRPDRRDLRYANESARFCLGECWILEAGVESVCKYKCDKHGPTCEHCESTLKMSCVSPIGLEFLADTGSEEDLTGRHDHVTYSSSVPIVDASKQVNLIAADRPVQGNKAVCLPVPEFGRDGEFICLRARLRFVP